jgi:hypothetical protein
MNGGRSASVYACGGIEVQLFPDNTFTEDGGKPCGSRGKGADV